MIKRLRIKFVCINMTIVTAMLGVIFGLVIFFMGIGMEIQAEQMMRTFRENALRPGGISDQRQEIWRPHFTVRILPHGEIQVLDSDFFEELDEQMLKTCIAGTLETGETSGVLSQYQLRFERTHSPRGQIIVFVDISSETATMKNLIRTCAQIAIMSFGIFFVVSVLLARWAVKPVENAWNQQRQFVADASHELKTPLTVIMTNAELLQTPGYEETERKRFVSSIMTMSQQMRGLVESLLEQARVDNGVTQTVFSQVDFSELTAEATLPFEPVYFENGLVLRTEIEPGVLLMGSYAHLKQVVDILLDNGVKYTDPNGEVLLRLRRQGNHCLLSVANPGEPISREELKNIFKRFYRADKARTMNHSYGLGLSIAESIVKNHNGKIWAESENGINTFFVQLPAAVFR